MGLRNVHRSCMFSKALWRRAEAYQLGPSAGVLCHVFMSPVLELPWELALPLRSSFSECTVACPWEMLLLGFPVRQENNGICWIKLIMPARHALLWLCAKIQILMNTLTLNLPTKIMCLSHVHILSLFVSFKRAPIHSVTQSKEKERRFTQYFAFLTPSHPLNIPPFFAAL